MIKQNRSIEDPESATGFAAQPIPVLIVASTVEDFRVYRERNAMTLLGARFVRDPDVLNGYSYGILVITESAQRLGNLPEIIAVAIMRGIVIVRAAEEYGNGSQG